jgi:hypothetical protein
MSAAEFLADPGVANLLPDLQSDARRLEEATQELMAARQAQSADGVERTLPYPTCRTDRVAWQRVLRSEQLTRRRRIRRIKFSLFLLKLEGAYIALLLLILKTIGRFTAPRL